MLNTTKVLITGATAGIGEAIAKALAKEGCELIVHGRNPTKCNQLVKDIQALGGLAQAEMADFSSLSQVRAMVDRLMDQKIDTIINNAGVWMNEEQKTEDGFELTWQVNYLAPFLLTKSLLPVLLERPNARVINISSSGHRAGRIHFEDINLRAGFNGMVAYCQSKLANVLFTQELARRTHGSSLSTYAVDPGAVQTDLLAKTGFNPPAGPAEKMIAKWLPSVLDPQNPNPSGSYFNPNGSPAKPSNTNSNLAAKLWLLGEEQVGG